MRAVRVVVTGAMAASLLGSMSVAGADEDAERIMFIGNSLTQTYDVPALVQGLAASADPPTAIEVKDATIGGATLGMFINAQAPERIRRGTYDAVVMQGDIPANYTDTADRFITNATVLIEAAQESGARTVMYMTWPYAPFDAISIDDIVTAHRQLEADLGVSIAPVGLAIQASYAERPDLPMLASDAHQTMPGAYLAAATIYSALYDRSPEGLPYRPEDLSEEDAGFLQRIAWQTMQEWQTDVPPAE